MKTLHAARCAKNLVWTSHLCVLPTSFVRVKLYILSLSAMWQCRLFQYSRQISVRFFTRPSCSQKDLGFRLVTGVHAVVWEQGYHTCICNNESLISKVTTNLHELCRVGEHQHKLAHRCSLWEFSHIHSVNWKHNGMGHFMTTGWGILESEPLLFQRYAKKKHWYSGEYPFLSSHDHGFGLTQNTTVETLSLLEYLVGKLICEDCHDT